MAQLLERAELPKQQADHVKVVLEAGRGLQTLLDDRHRVDPRRRGTARGRGLRSDADRPRRGAVVAAARLGKASAFVAGRHRHPCRAWRPTRAEVRQVLLKLVDNALKFTDRGLVDDIGWTKCAATAAVTSASPSPTPAWKAWRRKWRRSSSVPFTLGDKSYTRKQQGAGLGLAVAKRIVAQAGGEIGFDGLPSEGAQFFFTLPVSGSAGLIRPQRHFRRSRPDAAVGPDAAGARQRCRHGEQRRQPAGALRQPYRHRPQPGRGYRLGRAHYFDAIIAGADEADTLAAAPGVTAPMVAILLRGERAPAATDRAAALAGGKPMRSMARCPNSPLAADRRRRLRNPSRRA